MVTIAGQTLAVDMAGPSDAPPVVLLHGIPGWRGTWRRVARRLGGRARVIAPDLAGFGESSAAPTGFHAAGQARLVVELIRTLHLGPVHLVGFDFGGPVAVLARAQAPDVVATLTLAATNLLTDTPIPLPLQAVRPPLVGDLFARLFFGRPGLTLMWSAAVGRRERFSLGEYRTMLRFAEGVRSTRRVFQASLRDLPGLYGPVEAALGGIDVPTRVIWGERDPFFPVAVGRRTAARIPNARFEVLKGCGHFLPMEDPEGVAAAIAVPR
jgi:pimeloyl-ACP methyl ester carboxylesterase